MNEQSNYIAFLGFLAVTILFAFTACFAFITGSFPAAGLSALLVLLGIYRLWDSAKNGLRAPNRYEWFKYAMTLRPIAVGGIAIAFIALVAFYGRDWFGEALFESTPFMAGFALAAVAMIGLLIYSAFRAPYRRESDESYKARIGWKD